MRGETEEVVGVSEIIFLFLLAYGITVRIEFGLKKKKAKNEHF